MVRELVLNNAVLPLLGENSRSALEGEVPGVNNAVLREVAAGSFSIFPPN